MKDRIMHYQKALTFVAGIFFILMTLLLYFWDTPQSVSVAQSVSQIDRETGLLVRKSNLIERKKQQDISVLSSALQGRKEQGKTLLLVMLVLGIGLLLYSLITPSKRREL